MKQFIITVSDEKVVFFRELLSSFSFIKEMKEETIFDIPEEQKAEVRERIHKYKTSQEEYLEWDEIEKKLNSEE